MKQKVNADKHTLEQSKRMYVCKHVIYRNMKKQRVDSKRYRCSLSLSTNKGCRLKSTVISTTVKYQPMIDSVSGGLIRISTDG